MTMTDTRFRLQNIQYTGLCANTIIQARKCTGSHYDVKFTTTAEYFDM